MSPRPPDDLPDLSEPSDLADLMARLAEDRLLPGEGRVLAQRLSEHQAQEQSTPDAEAVDDRARETSTGDLFEPFRRLVTSTLGIGRRLETERDDAENLLAELAALDPVDRLRRIRTDRRFATWGVAEGLLRDASLRVSKESRRSGPGPVGDEPSLDAADRVELALEIAHSLPIEIYSRELLADLQASAYSLRARTRAERGDLAGADEAIFRARDFLRNGSGEPSLRGRVFEVAGNVARRCGRRAEASVDYERAFNGFARSEQHHDSARCGWARACVLREIGDLPKATDLLRMAAASIDPSRDARLAIDIWHELAQALLAEGQIAESRRWLRRARAEAVRASNKEVDGEESWRRSWLEGRLAAAEGSVAQAERQLHRARQVCLAEGRPIDALRIGLDLAGLLIKADRADDLGRLVDQLADRSNVEDLGGPASAALTMLLATHRHGSATCATVGELERFLDRSGEMDGLEPLTRRHVGEIDPNHFTELA